VAGMLKFSIQGDMVQVEFASDDEGESWGYFIELEAIYN
jgi:hypothetical protein